MAEIDYSMNPGKWTFPSLYYKASYSFAGGTRHADFIFIDTIVMCGLTVDPDSRCVRYIKLNLNCIISRSVASWLWTRLTNKQPLNGPLPRHVEEDRKQWEWLKRQLNESK